MTVIPVYLPALTTIRNIISHRFLARITKLSSHDGAHTGLAVPASRRRR